MILATYREDEVERSNHPLKNIKAELQAHNQCAHLRLKLLPQSAVEEYLADRLETEVVPSRCSSPCIIVPRVIRFSWSISRTT